MKNKFNKDLMNSDDYRLLNLITLYEYFAIITTDKETIDQLYVSEEYITEKSLRTINIDISLKKLASRIYDKETLNITNIFNFIDILMGEYNVQWSDFSTKDNLLLTNSNTYMVSGMHFNHSTNIEEFYHAIHDRWFKRKLRVYKINEIIG